MIVRRWFGILLVWILIMGALGSVPFPITAPLSWTLQQFMPQNWHITLDEAEWAPWRQLVLTDVRILAPEQRRFHWVDVRIRPVWPALLRGRWQSHWQIRDVRMDPGSWRIRQPLAQELLSAGPVFDTGSLLLKIKPSRLVIKDGKFEGRLIRLDRLELSIGPKDMDLQIDGKVTSLLLYGLGRVKLNPVEDMYAWRPFELRISGPFKRPSILFDSDFRTVSIRTKRRSKK